jgi:predicted transcriptional regulator
MIVLLSIKPEFAKKIFDGTKKYEFRRKIFKNDVSKVVVYASSPVKSVIGEFEVADILYNDTETLWQKTKKYSGITKDFFDAYFAEQDKAYAIKVGKMLIYDKPKLLSELGLGFAPQSFVYL